MLVVFCKKMLFFILEKCILIDDDSKLFGLIRIYGENIW